MDDTIATVVATLDPVLTDLGFAAGQDGGVDESADTGQIIWCVAYAEFQPRFPWLPQATGQGVARGYECVDLTVMLELGRIVAVELEGESLGRTFTQLGEGARAERADAVTGVAAATGSAALVPLLSALFTAPAARG